MADEPKLTKYLLIICFAAAVVVLGVREIHHRVTFKRSAQSQKLADANLVAHLYGVSDVERSRYSKEVVTELVKKRNEKPDQTNQTRWESWAAFFDF